MVVPLTPTITSFTPTNGRAGTTVTLTGTNFPGVSSVTFNGVSAASVTVQSATTLTAVVFHPQQQLVRWQSPRSAAVSA
jgi:hypothetical protein